ncbi:Sensory box/GGDEF family protein [Moritella viscosa]|uniref:diguanylate cyclase n=1 Tax=Moritella viscosa TaxID=80854 RepID=A0A090IJJ9_9GAMM|nr:GGDEF domain-containing protein [Moritella viscosa]CED61412.1 putative membrane associated signaling protein, GGDEF family protein [Moritella viscosa]SGY96562.1 Sensory box/GGDEF family protein [Moritella viscosa]SHO04322.1 Sensory box/GGDEF family protein [Moritella viscosa]SHO04323.1 Sensory box/GGDEF family protein [Moritella viscosa]SHO05156.1 Sensory box/GGDEF family protein [Moritella viscosa]
MDLNYQFFITEIFSWWQDITGLSTSTSVGMTFWLVVIALLITILVILTLLRKLTTYQSLLTFSATPTLVLDIKKGTILYSNSAIATIFDQENNTSNIIAQCCFERLSHRVDETTVTNDVFHIKQLKKTLRFSAVQINYQRRRAWLCQIEHIGTNSSAISPWDMDGQIINSLFLSNSAFIHIKTLDGLILNCSPSWAAQFEQSVEQVNGHFEHNFYSASKLKQIHTYEKTVLTGEVQEYEEWRTADDDNMLLQTIKYPLYDEHEKVVAILTVSHDLTEVMELNERLLNENGEHLRIEAELSRNNSLLNSVINATPDPVAFMNENGKFVGANEGYCEVVGVKHADLIGMDRKNLISIDKKTWLLEQENQLLLDGKSVRYEELLHLSDQDSRWYEICKQRYINNMNGESGILIIYRDLTERKRIEHDLEQAIEKFDELSSTDALTKVANRRTFDNKLTHYWLTHHNEVKKMSLLFCDVDCFKLYNDNYGHPMGDVVLAKIAQVMNDQVHRGADLVARYGGEEFAVILPSTDEEGAIRLASKIITAVEGLGIEHAYSKAAKDVTLSIGIATMCPESESSEVQLLENADKALYIAKENGRNQYSMYQEPSNDNTILELDFDLLKP